MHDGNKNLITKGKIDNQARSEEKKEGKKTVSKVFSLLYFKCA